MKRKIVVITPDLLYQLFTQGNRINVVCTEGLPEDARFVGMSHDFQRDIYRLAFDSEAFDPVPFGAVSPEMTVAYTTIYLGTLLERAERLIETQYDGESTRWLEEYRTLKDGL